jgi:hypothetical protein
MDERTLTEDDVLALADAAADVVATINVAGPLVTDQTLILPDGTALEPPHSYYWAYHHAAVINVDRELQVIDLSLGDEPIPIEDWVSGFVEPSIECNWMDEEEFANVWTYWNAAFANLVPEEPPARTCGYTITPIFTFRWDQEPLAEVVTNAPSTMLVLLGGLETLLGEHDVSLPREQLPLVTSSYAPLSVTDVCEWNDLIFCSL